MASEIEVGGVRLTSPDRVLWDAQGITKRELAEYYEAVAAQILPELVGRPLTLLRCPAGRQKECFVQRRASESFPRSIRRVVVSAQRGGATYVAVDTLEGLLALVQIGVLELHTWGSRRDRLERPDRMILDLDPAEDVSWPRVIQGAHDVRELLGDVGLDSLVKTSGGKGLHVIVPLERRHGWDEVRELARAVAEELVRRAPERYLAQAEKKARGGRIYVDYLRNAWGASAIAAYSPRARPGAPVSMPLAWAELGEETRPESFTVRTVAAKLAGRDDPWAGSGAKPQRITRTVRKALGVA